MTHAQAGTDKATARDWVMTWRSTIMMISALIACRPNTRRPAVVVASALSPNALAMIAMIGCRIVSPSTRPDMPIILPPIPEIAANSTSTRDRMTIT